MAGRHFSAREPATVFQVQYIRTSLPQHGEMLAILRHVLLLKNTNARTECPNIVEVHE